MKILHVILALLIVVVFCGCREKDDKTNPLMRKGDQYRAEGNAALAENFYRRMLEKYPNSATASLALATLYDESLERPEAALFFYEEYLRLAPADSPDRAAVESYRRNAREKLLNSLSENSPAMQTLKVENQQLRDRIDELKRYIFGQQKRINALAGAAPVVPPPAVRSPRRVVEAPAENGEAKPGETIFYTVRAGDTPGKIAKRFYGAASKYRLILEANNLANSTGLKIGQVLKIPPEK